ncbi:hypothetical protein F8M41_026488 [Gigaspora margarita]|uniref:Uncharacterized protein n=1 Tax=Gigaspora margarita TaxID=4874 RepID=A0A8H4ESR5_GIGMA|nr:hypothetical protein F8M41_026488 [Gigaspora margarita]
MYNDNYLNLHVANGTTSIEEILKDGKEEILKDGKEENKKKNLKEVEKVKKNLKARNLIMNHKIQIMIRQRKCRR